MPLGLCTGIRLRPRKAPEINRTSQFAKSFASSRSNGQPPIGFKVAGANSVLSVPAVFVVRFTDQIKWISLADIDARLCMIGGCSRTVKSRNDIEPIIEVPIDQMRALTPGTEPKGAAT
jgi:hypothetical protein